MCAKKPEPAQRPFLAALQTARADLVKRRNASKQPLEKRILTIQARALGARLRQLRRRLGLKSKPAK